MRAPAQPLPPLSARFRKEVLTLVVLVVVGALAATFAHLFVVAGEYVLDALFGQPQPSRAALATSRWVVVIVACLAVAVSAAVALLSRSAGSGRTGLGGVKLALDGDPADAGAVRPSLRATLVRAGGTLASSVGFTSIGRETAMIETGGALGATVAHRLRLSPAVAVGGVAAAFTAAYTAPLGGLAYADDHLHIRRHPRAVLYALVGAVSGYVTALLAWERHSVLPHPAGRRGALVLLGMVIVGPVTLASRGLFELRRRTERTKPAFGTRWWIVSMVAAAASVGVARAAAGNGMNQLSLAAAEPVLWAALGLALFRVTGMLAALAAGVPGGVILPTMAVAGGWGLLTMVTVEALGIDLPGSRWDAMILAAAIGVAIGLRAPVMAVVLVPEMVGDYTLLPFTAGMVVLAVGVDRAVNVLLRQMPCRQMPSRASSPTERPGEPAMPRIASSTPGMKLERS